MTTLSTEKRLRSAMAALPGLGCGVADACTLIVLERCGMLEQVKRWIHLVLIVQVATEVGPSLAARLSGPVSIAPGPADGALIKTASRLRLPVLSEDRRVLNSAADAGLRRYNALMLLLALFSQGRLAEADCRQAMDRLYRVSRYGDRVVDFGEQLFARISEAGLRARPDAAAQMKEIADHVK